MAMTFNRTVPKSILLIAIALPTTLIASVYGVSEWKMTRAYDVELSPMIEDRKPDLAHGERMARIAGCWAGCHGTRGEGGVEQIDGIRRVTAPTLSQVVPQYSDAELLRLIWYGVKKNRQSAIGMSSYTFWVLGEKDVSDIIDFLRRQPVLPAVPRSREIPFMSRVKLLRGEWKLPADQVDRSIPRWGDLPMTTPYERGRYLAALVCAECHGKDSRGDPLEGGPSLAILAAYDQPQFTYLLKTGISSTGRLIERMSWLPDVEFTDEDSVDLYVYLSDYHDTASH
jgi:cytochrome c553